MTSKLRTAIAAEISSGAATAENINSETTDSVGIAIGASKWLRNPRGAAGIESASTSTTNISKLKSGSADAVGTATTSNTHIVTLTTGAVEIASAVAAAVEIGPKHCAAVEIAPSGEGPEKEAESIQN